MSSPKKKSTKRKVDCDLMLAAIKEVKIDKKPARAVAREYNIPRSTLNDNMKKLNELLPDITAVDDADILEILRQNSDRNLTIFTSEQEAALLEYIVECGIHYHGLSVIELRKLAYQFAIKNDVECPETWNENSMAGEKWYRLFMKRYGISDHKEETQKKDELDEQERAAKAPTTAAKATRTTAITKKVSAKTSAERGKEKTLPSPQSSAEGADFCIICLKTMPPNLTRNNSIRCDTCNRAVHLKCTDMLASYFRCKHCDSDYDEELEENDA